MASYYYVDCRGIVKCIKIYSRFSLQKINCSDSQMAALNQGTIIDGTINLALIQTHRTHFEGMLKLLWMFSYRNVNYCF